MTASSRYARPSVARAFVIPILFVIPLLAGCQRSKEAEPTIGSSGPKPSPTEINVVPPHEATPPAHSEVVPDAIVVGAGISGLSAALELARGGAAVTVIDSGRLAEGSGPSLQFSTMRRSMRTAST